MRLLLVSCLALAACAPTAAPYYPAPLEPSGEPIRSDCPIVGSSGWAAWVNGMPGPSAQPTLIVTGQVTVPTGGYRFDWRDMRIMESHPVQIAIDLQAIPPAGLATQALVTHDVRGEWRISPPVGSLTVRCGDRVLARIAPVETAQ